MILSPEERARTVVATRVIDFPIADVFDAYANPQKIVRWWGPHGFTIATDVIDMKPGGHWQFVFTGPDGREYKNHIVFSTIEAPHLFVVDHVSGPHYRGTITFEVVGTGTRVTMYQTFEDAFVFGRIKDIATNGNEENLDRLTDLLNGER